jgi:hypothetical protein
VEAPDGKIASAHLSGQHGHLTLDVDNPGVFAGSSDSPAVRGTWTSVRSRAVGAEPVLVGANRADEYVLDTYGAEVLVHGAVVKRTTILRTGARIDVGGHSLSFFREEHADHGRPYGGRSGGEIGHQRRQPPRPSSGQGTPAR